VSDGKTVNAETENAGRKMQDENVTRHQTAEVEQCGKCSILPRDAMHSADYAVARCPPVSPSVCLSHVCILSKWLNISSHFFHRRVATPF